MARNALISKILQNALNTISQAFVFSKSIFVLIIALVPVNVFPNTDVKGPTSLNALEFITLGLRVPSECGKVKVETFELTDGVLTEHDGLTVFFTEIDKFKKNKFGASKSSALVAGKCDKECTLKNQFCVDKEGYLVSVAPTRMLPWSDRVNYSRSGRRIPKAQSRILCVSQRGSKDLWRWRIQSFLE